MHFSAEDPLAVHVVASAAHHVLHDLAECNGRVGFHRFLQSCFLPGGYQAFRRELSKPANFLKHANRDPNRVINGFKDMFNDAEIGISCLYLKGLEPTMSAEVKVFLVWYLSVHSNMVKDEFYTAIQMTRRDFEWLQQASRAEQLRLGNELLERYTSSGLCG